MLNSPTVRWLTVGLMAVLVLAAGCRAGDPVEVEDAKAQVDSYGVATGDVLESVGGVAGEIERSIEDCNSGLSGAPTDAGRIVLRTEWDGIGPGDGERIAKSLDVVVPLAGYDNQIGKVAGYEDGYSVIVAFNMNGDTDGGTMTVSSPCVDGAA